MAHDSIMYDTFVKSFAFFWPQFLYRYNYRGSLDFQGYCPIMVSISISMYFNHLVHPHHLHFQVLEGKLVKVPLFVWTIKKQK